MANYVMNDETNIVHQVGKCGDTGARKLSENFAKGGWVSLGEHPSLRLALTMAQALAHAVVRPCGNCPEVLVD